MNGERLRIDLETSAIRTRGWIRFGLSVVGVALVLVGAWNVLLAPTIGVEALVPHYRRLLSVAVVSDGGVVHLADIVLIGVGAIAGWFP